MRDFWRAQFFPRFFVTGHGTNLGKGDGGTAKFLQLRFEEL